MNVDSRRLANLANKLCREFNAKFGTQLEPADITLRCRFGGGFVAGASNGLPDWEAQAGNMFAVAPDPEHALSELTKKVKAAGAPR